MKRAPYIFALMMLAWPAQAGDASFEVQSSNNSSVAIGKMFAASDSIALSKGQPITFIRHEGSTVSTRMCEGPYQGQVEKCTLASDRCSWLQRMLGHCADENPVDEGGMRWKKDGQ